MLRLITSTYKVKTLFQIFSKTKIYKERVPSAIIWNAESSKILEINQVSTWSEFIILDPTIQNSYNWHIHKSELTKAHGLIILDKPLVLYLAWKVSVLES